MSVKARLMHLKSVSLVKPRLRYSKFVKARLRYLKSVTSLKASLQVSDISEGKREVLIPPMTRYLDYSDQYAYE